ncbi:MAG: hypothetical protein LBQ32_06270 [Burkholderiaceae bacterium]|jgi:hypothetical protein|nr:hypothetical protein [Burkholderiaceae bacterium]
MANTAASRAATAAPLAQSGRALDRIQRQAAIENALSMALHFMRQPTATPGQHAANLWAATARTNRALTLLKTASAYAYSQGRD